MSQVELFRSNLTKWIYTKLGGKSRKIYVSNFRLGKSMDRMTIVEQKLLDACSPIMGEKEKGCARFPRWLIIF